MRPIGIVREARSHRAIETFEQEEYVRCFEEQLRDGQPRLGRPLDARRFRTGEPTQIERYRGCLLGLAVCDALGTTLEFMPPGSFRPHKRHDRRRPVRPRAGEWTDDTSMAPSLAESLIERRGFDPSRPAPAVRALVP